MFRFDRGRQDQRGQIGGVYTPYWNKTSTFQAVAPPFGAISKFWAILRGKLPRAARHSNDDEFFHLAPPSEIQNMDVSGCWRMMPFSIKWILGWFTTKVFHEMQLFRNILGFFFSSRELLGISMHAVFSERPTFHVFYSLDFFRITWF